MAAKVARIGREDLLEFVRNELICTIGSADAPVTIPVLITTFRDDTNEDILQLANKLGHPSIEAMLAAKEFDDIVEPCYTDLAKGAGNERPKKVFSYRVKSNPLIAHILSSIEESNQYKDSKETDKQRQLEVVIGDPKYNPSILTGKEKLLSLIYELGGEDRFVDLTELQKAHKEAYSEELNKTALKRHFPTGQLKGIMDRYLYQDVELATDKNKNGSLLFRLKRPFKEICVEIGQIVKEREKHLAEEAQRKRLQEENKQRKAYQKPNKGPAQQPKKLRVINPPPQPKPKPIPLVESMVHRRDELYTDDPLLFQKIQRENEEDEDGENEEDRQERLHQLLYGSKDDGPKKKYTTRLEGATYTDEEDGGDEGRNEEEEQDDEEGEGPSGDTSFPEEEQHSSSSHSNIKTAGIIERALPKPNPKQIEESDEDEEISEERTLTRLRIMQKRQEERRAFKEQVQKRNEVCGAVEGVFGETKRFGRRAREEDARRERVANLLEKMAPAMADKAPLVVDDRMSENSKRRIAALVVELIWANRELGISEVRNMLKLMFCCDVQIDVERFVASYCKCVKPVRAPIEPHLKIHETMWKQIRNEIAQMGKIFSQPQKKMKTLKKL